MVLRKSPPGVFVTLPRHQQIIAGKKIRSVLQMHLQMQMQMQSFPTFALWLSMLYNLSYKKVHAYIHLTAAACMVSRVSSVNTKALTAAGHGCLPLNTRQLFLLPH